MAERADAPSGGRTARQAVEILVVDDQPAKLLSYEAILAPLGERIVVARSGREALEVLLQREVAVILLDVVMPDMDGLETATLIRAHPRFAKTPIIFVTAVSTGELERLRAYELGAVDYVYVPIVAEILRAKVAAFVDLYRMSRELRTLNRELEDRVAERTATLEDTAATLRERAAELEREVGRRRSLEGELRERADRLAQADRAKNEFLAMLAHELRNPLSAVLHAIEVLRLAGADGTARARACELAERQAHHLARLLDDLLDVSRITSGKIALRTRRVRVQELVRGIEPAIAAELAARSHTLVVSLPETPLWVEVDPARMEQVLLNLLSNAIKYTDPGGRIDVLAEREADVVRLRVRDTGIGMTADVLPQVFQLFAQANRALDRAQGGLGIGLTVAERLVALHGGRIEAASAGPGQGSEFTVVLPAASPPAEAVAEPRAAAPAPSGKRILIVEDNADVADSLTMLLRAMGHEVSAVGDGPSAILHVRESRPEVVLLDIGLPGMDGYQVAEALRLDATLAGLKLVALTGYAMEADLRRSRQCGFDHHLAKPVSLSTLQALLQRI